MDWNDEQQSRFDDLRQRELAGTLDNAERQELDVLMTMLTEAADEALLPAVAKLQREQEILELRLRQRQDDNEELAKLLHQQEKLTAESRQWLHDFDRRHAYIHKTYTQLTGEVLTAS
ncbi:MAG: hypothetical protein GY803_07520 [Chloroflexi bacterium]|nr:hypothetical protein [Chloroflexota bacterium]